MKLLHEQCFSYSLLHRLRFYLIIPKYKVFHCCCFILINIYINFSSILKQLIFSNFRGIFPNSFHISQQVLVKNKYRQAAFPEQVCKGNFLTELPQILLICSRFANNTGYVASKIMLCLKQSLYKPLFISYCSFRDLLQGRKKPVLSKFKIAVWEDAP